MAIAKISPQSVGSTLVPLGIAWAELTTITTTTALIPQDNTIPQITEGTEILNTTYTPKISAGQTSLILVEAQVYGSPSVQNWIIATLFQDSNVNAIKAAEVFVTTGGGGNGITLKALINNTSTSATTFRLRVGQALAGTLTINGQSSSGQRYGGVYATTLQVTEYLSQ